MTFLFETVDQKVAQERAAALHRSHVLCLSTDQAVDSETGAIFMCLGGRGGEVKNEDLPPTSYALLLEGREITLECYYVRQQQQGVVAVEVEIVNFAAPREFEPRLQFVKDLLQDAFNCYWNGISMKHKYAPQPSRVALAFPSVTYF